MANQNVQPIDWPVVQIAGRPIAFRVSYAAHFQLARWGKNIATATTLELAAASAGTFDASGKWHSEGYDRVLDLADMMEDGDEEKITKAVIDAIKKAYPEVAVSSQPTPGPIQTTTTGSESGHLELVQDPTA